MSSIRAVYVGANEVVRSWASNEVVRPLLEPVLHPSPWRIGALGVSSLSGHPLFYWIWKDLLPQPYEDLALRLLMSALGGALLVLASVTDTPPRRSHATAFTLIFWINLPFFFWWMYFCNGGNTVWLASVGVMFLIYYHVTDWRLATLGSASGLLLAWLLFDAVGPETAPMGREQLATNAVVIAFSWIMGLLLGISSSNLRREQLNYTLGTMGIMAHELRTPLATISLIGDAVRNEASRCDAESRAELEKLSQRLLGTVRNMNHQIDTQIGNARLMRLPGHLETVSAAALVREAVDGYPFRTASERDCVSVRIRDDFRFRGSHALFVQVLHNLMKNALRSLAASKHPMQPGDLLIEVTSARDPLHGLIIVSDRGVGMDANLRARIFQPFFSTNRGTGHGLGLAFCQRVVQSANGTIGVESEPAQGATFTIELSKLGDQQAPVSPSSTGHRS